LEREEDFLGVGIRRPALRYLILIKTRDSETQASKLGNRFVGEEIFGLGGVLIPPAPLEGGGLPDERTAEWTSDRTQI